MRWGNRCGPPPHSTPVPTPTAQPPLWASVMTNSGGGHGVHHKRWRMITLMAHFVFLTGFAVVGSQRLVCAIYRLYRRSAMACSAGSDLWDDMELFDGGDLLTPSQTPIPPSRPEAATALLNISDEEVCPEHEEQPDIPVACPANTGSKRRKVTTGLKRGHPALQAVPEPEQAWMKVRCMMFPDANSKKKNLIAVALWPQYEIALPGQSGDPQRWVILGNYEEWFLQLCQRIAKGARRENAQFLRTVFWPIFTASLRKARGRMIKAKLEDSEEEDADDQNDAKNLRIPFKVHPYLRVTMGDFTVTCLNSGRECVILVDEDCTKFIKGFLLPLAAAQTSALSQSGAVTPKGQKPETAGASFSFSSTCTPNIRDKVSWDPMMHGWKMSIKKPHAKLQPFMDESGNSLRVDPSLTVTAYAAEKNEKYLKAIETWNAVDGSTRERIPTTPSPHAE